MRAVIQRVSEAKVTIGQETVGQIGRGYMVLLGIEDVDTEQDADYICDKIIGLRVFEDDHGKMNLGILDVNGAILLISQFTLYGDARHGRRPSFIKAAGRNRPSPFTNTPSGGCPSPCRWRPADLGRKCRSLW